MHSSTLFKTKILKKIILSHLLSRLQVETIASDSGYWLIHLYLLFRMFQNMEVEQI